MDGLRRFMEADNQSAVDVEGLRRGALSVNVKKPQFSEAFSRGGYQRRSRRVDVAS